ncbi:hypothetical protein CIPAW_13G102900 [Carya illinoinensis]|uniref:Uncharacterized protein n=1 Tax=Carya illinoinensis TaxID=32201 RepID=A0A8T1NPH9_CARIL|nr:hypothetical protein CIPAW_13G102900 [Carya illinoinensis]
MHYFDLEGKHRQPMQRSKKMNFLYPISSNLDDNGSQSSPTCPVFFCFVNCSGRCMMIA